MTGVSVQECVCGELLYEDDHGRVFCPQGGKLRVPHT